MKNWKISTKLIGLAFIGGAGSIAALVWLSVSHGTAALLEQETSALEAVRRSRQSNIENYFGFIREQVFNFVQDEMIVDATRSFALAFKQAPMQLEIPSGRGSAVFDAVRGYYDDEFRPRLEAAGGTWRGTDHYVPHAPSARLLQAMYIVDNAHPIGSKHRLDSVEGVCDYNQLHRRYHPRIRDFLESFGYYDIFLFDLDGNLMYSVFKETDFATNFLTGPYRDTNFAEVFAEAQHAPPGTIIIRDFARYEPSYGAPASFIGAPVFAGEHRLGVAVFQMPVDKINEIMTEVAGLGETGETYLIGEDHFLRSDSRFGEATTILAQSVNTESARRALSGGSGTLTQADYRGVEVLSSYGPLAIEGLNWAMLAEVDMAEITAPAIALRNRLVAIGFALAVVVGLPTVFFLRRIVLVPVQRANMRHELRAPTNAIIDCSETLMEEAERLGQDDFIPELKKINAAGKHLLALINSVATRTSP